MIQPLSGLMCFLGRVPRVARSGQPWAGRFNPVGIGGGDRPSAFAAPHRYPQAPPRHGANPNGIPSVSPGLVRGTSTYPGFAPKESSTPTGLHRIHTVRPGIAAAVRIARRSCDDSTLSGLIRVVGAGPQGSPRRATLGWMIQSRWDCAAVPRRSQAGWNPMAARDQSESGLRAPLRAGIRWRWHVHGPPRRGAKRTP